MTLPDVNLLVYAYNSSIPQHERARRWWEDLMSGPGRVGLPWAVSCGFIRLVTHPRVLEVPMPSERALGCVRSWLTHPDVTVLEPGPRHLDLLDKLLQEAGVAGALTSDAHLAALAIEHNCELHSADRDFGRFSGLRWHNPLGGQGIT